MRRYLYTESDLPVAPPPALQVGDDSDSWWAGVQRCFVAIPLAASIAAVALSASLAWGYQQKTEEVVPQPPTLATEDYAWTAAPRVDRVVAWLPPDDQVPAGVLFGQPDEDFWRVHTPPYPPLSFLYLPDPEELPAGSLSGQPDEDFWHVFTPPYVPARPLYLPDPEELPAGSLLAFQSPDEDYWFNPPLNRDRYAGWQIIPDEETIPQPAAPVPEDEYWQVYTPPYPPLQWAPQVWITEDEIVSQPAPAFTPVEDYELVYAPSYPPLRFLYLIGPTDEFFVEPIGGQPVSTVAALRAGHIRRRRMGV